MANKLSTLLLLLFSVITIYAQQRITPKPQQVTRFDWAGTYIAETYEGRTYGGTGVGYEIVVKLTQSSKGKDAYYGTLTIDGYQTGVSASVTAYADGRHVAVYYNTDKDSFPALEYRKGDIVAEFTYTKDRRLYAEWFGDIRDSYVNDETTFRKKK